MTIHIDARLLRHYQRVARLLESLASRGEPWSVVAPSSPQPRGNMLVFPGSFNPPTLAHLAMLRQAHIYAQHALGGRWQVYAALSRHIVDKEAVERMTLLDRVVLLEHVLERYVSHVGVVLLNRGLYVEQAQGIRAAFPQVQRLFFLVGFDKIVQILDPRYYRERDSALCELFGLASLLVAPRGDDGTPQLQALLARPENRPFAHFIRPLPLAQQYRAISSTDARVAPTLEIVPREVRDFIERTQPYGIPSGQAAGASRDQYAERTQALQALMT